MYMYLFIYIYIYMYIYTTIIFQFIVYLHNIFEKQQ